MNTKNIWSKQIESDSGSNKKILLGIVLDTTLSFAKMYPQIYYFLEHLLMNIESMKIKYDDFETAYSVVLLHDDAEVLKLTGDSSISKEEKDVIKKLAEISFYGGKKDGAEELGSAVQLQFTTMERYCDLMKNRDCNISRELLVLTDSCATEGEKYRDFTKYNGCADGKKSYCGLQQAFIISYKSSYMPMLRMVNEDNRLAENNRNKCIFGDIEDLLKMDEEETLKAAERLAEKITGMR